MNQVWAERRAAQRLRILIRRHKHPDPQVQRARMDMWKGAMKRRAAWRAQLRETPHG